MAVAADTRCNGCGSGVSEWEEGRCAYCRADDRGDDQLLAHDSRGYLDVDGVTLIPCGCGCGKAPLVDAPRDPLLDVVRDIVGHGETVEIRLPQMPVQWRVDWIERLGGVIVIDPSAPMPLAMQRDKEEPNGNGREALERMDAGEPQRAERSEMPELNQCKIDGCHEEALVTRGRFAYLCADHRAERLAEARAEGSLGNKYGRAEPKPAPEAEPEPEPEEVAGELVPVPAASIANGSDLDRVDVFDLLGKMVTPELIAFHQAEAERHKAKAEALVSIYDELKELGVVEA